MHYAVRRVYRLFWPNAVLLWRYYKKTKLIKIILFERLKIRYVEKIFLVSLTVCRHISLEKILKSRFSHSLSLCVPLSLCPTLFVRFSLFLTHTHTHIHALTLSLSLYDKNHRSPQRTPIKSRGNDIVFFYIWLSLDNIAKTSTRNSFKYI